jgi:hypothetical protein
VIGKTVTFNPLQQWGKIQWGKGESQKGQGVVLPALLHVACVKKSSTNKNCCHIVAPAYRLPTFV